MAHIYLNFSTKKPLTQLFYLIYLVLCAQLLCSLAVIALQKLGIGIGIEKPNYLGLSILIPINQLLAFFCPALFWGFYYSPKSWRSNLHLRALSSNDYILLLISLLAIPATTIFEALNLSLIFTSAFPVELRQQIISIENIVVQLIQPLFSDLHLLNYIITFVLVAVLPAICEEFLFRAVLQKIMIRLTKKPMLGIYLTAFIFAFFHGQFLGFLPRFFLGIVLGLLFYRSKTILAPIVFHLIFNGIETIIVFFSGVERLKVPEKLEYDWQSWIIGILSLLLFIFLWRRKTIAK